MEDKDLYRTLQARSHGWEPHRDRFLGTCYEEAWRYLRQAFRDADEHAASDAIGFVVAGQVERLILAINEGRFCPGYDETQGALVAYAMNLRALGMRVRAAMGKDAPTQAIEDDLDCPAREHRALGKGLRLRREDRIGVLHRLAFAQLYDHLDPGYAFHRALMADCDKAHPGFPFRLKRGRKAALERLALAREACVQRRDRAWTALHINADRLQRPSRTAARGRAEDAVLLQRARLRRANAELADLEERAVSQPLALEDIIAVFALDDDEKTRAKVYAWASRYRKSLPDLLVEPDAP